MDRKKKLRLLLVIFLAVTGLQKSQAQEDRDFYLWNTTSAKVSLNQLYSLKVCAKVHYRVNDHFRDMTYFDVALSRFVYNWLDLGVAFRGAQLNKTSGDIMEYRPQFVTGVHFRVGDIKCKSTNRLEYRAFNEGDGYARYYHNFFVHFPSFCKCPKPYIGEEVFTKFNAENIHLVRIYSGLHLLELDHFQLDAYYVWQQLKSDNNWKDADIVGLNLSFII